MFFSTANDLIGIALVTKPKHSKAPRNAYHASSKYPPTPAALSWWMLTILLVALGLVSVSGVGLWYCIEFKAEGQLDASLWELRWRLIHGCSLPAMLIAFGMILRSHVFKGFQLGRNRFSGSLLLLTVAWLTISGWGLYYAAEDQWREFYQQTHEWFGFGLLGLILAHWFMGYRSRRELARSNVKVDGAIRQTGLYENP